MALSAVTAAVLAAVRTVDGLGQVPDAPPPQLNDERMALVYPRPRESAPMQHAARGARAVLAYRDTVVVEYHRLLAADQIAEFLSDATPMLDAVRLALWDAWLTDQFGGTVVLLHGIASEQFGDMYWGGQHTYGFQLALDVTHTADAG